MAIDCKARRIVVVDDSPDWMNALEGLLREYGEQREIQKLSRDAFLDRYQEPSDFDLVDYCFVDLELGVRTSKQRTDKYGLTQILPRIRAVAPWVPTACVSMWISNDPKILHELSVSDFDGLYPKELIGSEDEELGQFRTEADFNRERWSGILRDLSIKRIAALSGRSVRDVALSIVESTNLELIPSQSVKDEVFRLFGEEELRQAIAALGLGGAKVSLKEIVTGFSGVFVIKAEVFGNAASGTYRSRWLLKLGQSPAKLARESHAHRQIFCRGIDRRLIVGQLFPHPLIWRGVGIIAYGFEEQNQTALEVAMGSGLERLAEALESIRISLYAYSDEIPCDIRDVVQKWIGSSDPIMKVMNEANEPLVVSSAMIHGDLHLRNILIWRSTGTLIDFARSSQGPIAIDAGKLVADILVFVNPELLQPDRVSWKSLAETSLGPILSVFESCLKAENDIQAFNTFLRAYLVQYQTYDDVPLEVKKILASL